MGLLTNELFFQGAHPSVVSDGFVLKLEGLRGFKKDAAKLLVAVRALALRGKKNQFKWTQSAYKPQTFQGFMHRTCLF